MMIEFISSWYITILIILSGFLVWLYFSIKNNPTIKKTTKNNQQNSTQTQPSSAPSIAPKKSNKGKIIAWIIGGIITVCITVFMVLVIINWVSLIFEKKNIPTVQVHEKVYEITDEGTFIYLHPGWKDYPTDTITIQTPIGKILEDNPNITTNFGYQPEGWYKFKGKSQVRIEDVY